VPKAPQEAVKVVLMPDGGFAVAVEVSSPPSSPGPNLDFDSEQSEATWLIRVQAALLGATNCTSLPGMCVS